MMAPSQSSKGRHFIHPPTVMSVPAGMGDAKSTHGPKARDNGFNCMAKSAGLPGPRQSSLTRDAPPVQRAMSSLSISQLLLATRLFGSSSHFAPTRGTLPNTPASRQTINQNRILSPPFLSWLAIWTASQRMNLDHSYEYARTVSRKGRDNQWKGSG